MNLKMSFWQATFMMLLMMRCVLGMSIAWWQVLLPLTVHLLIRLETQWRSGSKLPYTWWLQ